MILFHRERQSEDVVEKYPQHGLCHQLRHMFSLRDKVISLTWNRNLQSKLAEAIGGCSREVPTTWFVSPIEAYVQFEGQSDQSYMEQKLAVKIGICSIDKYLQQLGPRAATQTKNVLIHGIPGSGKSYMAQYLNLKAISKGLRLVPTLIMGV